ncbi:MAG: DNA (cytosine-5-)-methyltransferase, partial [Acidimicrobiaceae bacterium]|nr:DNA (cytosine-5-)-methyltransferase [Acidimicrobiaceae bacterium]
MQAAEFFAGVGLVRCGLQQAGIEVVWANDIEPTKLAVYAANFDASHYRLDDVRNIEGGDIPSVGLAAASFPCVDLSLAGNRRGLSGEQSGLFYEFTRILGEMRPRMPPVVLVENVASFVSSHRGEDLRAAVGELNSLGYVCDLLILDARSFTPQSRPRLFMIGTLGRVAPESHRVATPSRPAPVAAFMQANRDLLLQQLPLPAPPRSGHGLDSVVERLQRSDQRWWGDERLASFIESLSPLQSQRLDRLRSGPRLAWRTAYRRTRSGRAVWE